MFLRSMIPANELQAGNRIKALVPPYNSVVEVEVITINNNEIVAKTKSGQTGINLINAQPIALTEEWLRDNGFQIMKLKDVSFTNGSVVFYLYAKPGETGWYEDRNYTLKCK